MANRTVHLRGKAHPLYGKKPWNKGLNKDSDPRVHQQSLSSIGIKKPSLSLFMVGNKRGLGKQQKRAHLSGIRSWFYSKKNQIDIPCQSTYEFKVCQILEHDQTVLRYGRCRFFVLYYYQGDYCHYYPDFLVEYLDGRRVLLEVKSQWEISHPVRREFFKAKLIAAEQFCTLNGYIYDVWTEESIRKYL